MRGMVLKGNSSISECLPRSWVLEQMNSRACRDAFLSKASKPTGGMTDGWSVLVQGGVLLQTNFMPASAFLRSATPGAYTTTRTVGGGSNLLLWDRHLARLSESLQLLASAYPHLYTSLNPDLDVKGHVQPSVMMGLAQASRLRRAEEEINITVLLSGNQQAQANRAASACQVYVHASNYNAVGEGKLPLATSVAVMGPGRTLARAKYSLWANTRQALEKVRPVSTTEIILSNDGDSLLEGTLTNFFVVARTNQNVPEKSEDHMHMGGQDHSSSVDNVWSNVQVQTAPLEDGVLPGIIRSLVIEVCRESGIPLCEMAPSWADRHTWREAFVTRGAIFEENTSQPRNNLLARCTGPVVKVHGLLALPSADGGIGSVRILQPVLNIQMPTTWTFEPSPGNLPRNSWHHLELEKLVLERARQESIPLADVIRRQTSTDKT